MTDESFLGNTPLKTLTCGTIHNLKY